ncbi:MAG: transcriptional repressor [Hyphomicrobiales bacterium]|nr:MAG: transcriptional repressor [Hyphomicrobiales bacterium]
MAYYGAPTDMHPLKSSTDEVGATTLLRAAGLRPTRQRIALTLLLYGNGNRHLSAEQLHADAVAADIPVSLATVYNTLNQFTQAGLLRELAVDNSRAFYDTNTTEHHHFFVEGENEVLDVPDDCMHIEALPEPPEGMEITSVEVVVRLRRKR